MKKSESLSGKLYGENEKNNVKLSSTPSDGGNLNGEPSDDGRLNGKLSDGKTNTEQSKFTLPTGGTVSANNTVTPTDDDAALLNVGLSKDEPTVSEVVGGGHTIPTEKVTGDQFSQFATSTEQSHFTGAFENGTSSKINDKVYGNTDFSHGKTYGGFKACNEKCGGFTAYDASSTTTVDKKSESTADNVTRNTKNGMYRSTENHDAPIDISSVGVTRKAEKTDNSENEKDNSDNENDEKDRAVTVKKGERYVKTIVIAGQIEGHTKLPQEQKATSYEELIPQLVEIEENDEISGLLLILNTVGGDVEAGLALSELIAGMKKPTASLVLGGGHSIGIPLAVAAKKSFIAPSATMTLHPVRVTGPILSAPQTYVYLNNMQERIIDFTCSHCRISKERFYELMLAREEMSTDLGSVLDGKKAVDEGLIDSLGTLADAMNSLSGG